MPRLTIVQYKVKADAVADNERLSHSVFERVRRDSPENVSYALFKAEDGQSFTHVFLNPVADNSDAVTATPEFDLFQADLSARCEVPPEVLRQSVTIVDAYRFAPS